MKIVECVPNVSEGRDLGIIQAVEAELQRVGGVKVLHVDSGLDANRTVYTFAGAPEAVLEAAYALSRKATELIDMKAQSGAHPRLGAVDVIPFIPLSGVSMEECISLARRLGERIWSELRVPIFFYEEASTDAARKHLSDIRKGEYEGLKKKLKDSRWKPDVGEAEFNERSGAIVIGARKVLIAYNVNLDTRDAQVASDIAARIRTRGAGENRLAACRAIGWDMPKFGCAQVSMNLFDYEKTSPLDAFRACEREAAKFGVRVCGSELVGLIPLDALLLVAKQLGGEGKESELISAAVEALGLSQFNLFKPSERVIEYLLQKGRS